MKTLVDGAFLGNNSQLTLWLGSSWTITAGFVISSVSI